MPDKTTFRRYETKPRVFILTDISNEPDDAESFVRYLLYSNEFDTRGLVACTSTWMKSVIHPEDLVKILHAYGKVIDNLNAHVHPDNPYPTAQCLLELVKSGPAVYGRAALEDGFPLSEGAQSLVDRIEESEEPLWVLAWGGTNVLAQALQHIDETNAAERARLLRSRIRVYAISDQDDTGAWIRLKHPDIFYIVSVHGWNCYGLAAWTGISGEGYYKFDKGGPDSTKVSKTWIKENIQRGALGAVYPDHMFIPEGDTPTFLYLIQNGLGSSEQPHWGSWGGRYTRVDDGGVSNHFSDAVDRVIGQDGAEHISNQATIWRWRDAFQNDFAARIGWTMTPDTGKANHAPVVIVNGSGPGSEPVEIEAEAGSQIVLDASSSYDPDGDALTFSWFHYRDVTAKQWWVDAEVQLVTFVDQGAQYPHSVVQATLPPAGNCAVDPFSGEPMALGQKLHFVLEVRDSGMPSLTTYKRVVVQVTNRALLGRRAKVDSIAEVPHNF